MIARLGYTLGMLRALLPVFAVSCVLAQTAPIERLKESIETLSRSLNATWGIYVKCLETGEEVAISSDRQMDTMSVIKIPLMVEAFHQIQAGTLKLDTRYTLVKEDIRPGTGILRSLDAGDSITVRDLLLLMNIVSDNTATDVLFRMVGGPDAVNRRMSALGLKQTRATGPASNWFAALRAAPSAEQFHREAKTPFGLSSPREIGMLLERMERGELVDKASSEQMLSMMRGQMYRTRIPRFLGNSNIRIPHKTGDFLPYIGNDVGVLEMPGRTVVISILTANHFGSSERLEEAIGRIAEQAAMYFGYRQ